MLMKNKKLQHINISGSKIGDDGVRHITEGLEVNNTLTELELQYCGMSVKGIAKYTHMCVKIFL